MTACGNNGPLELVLVDQHGDVGSAIAQQFGRLCRADEVIGGGKRLGTLNTDSLAINVNQAADQLQAGSRALECGGLTCRSSMVRTISVIWRRSRRQCVLHTRA